MVIALTNYLLFYSYSTNIGFAINSFDIVIN